MTAKTDLQDLIRGALESEPRNPGPHPAKDRLLDLADGKIDGEAAEQLREHLASCRRCQAILRVERFAAQTAEETSSAEDEQEAVLRTVVSRCEPVSFAPPIAAPRARRSSWLALAAGLAAAILGGLLVHQMGESEKLERRLAATNAPAPIALYSLLPRGFQVRAGDSEQPSNTVFCPRGGEELGWIIPTGRLASQGGIFEVLLLRDGIELWKSQEAASRQGTVDLRLPGDFLRPGKIEVRLLAPAGSEGIVFDVLYVCPSP